VVVAVVVACVEAAVGVDGDLSCVCNCDCDCICDSGVGQKRRSSCQSKPFASESAVATERACMWVSMTVVLCCVVLYWQKQHGGVRMT
jgi:hypothetical protein